MFKHVANHTCDVAVLGALQVIALFLLSLTVMQSTVYGFMFYANIIEVNSLFFFFLVCMELQNLTKINK